MRAVKDEAFMFPPIDSCDGTPGTKPTESADHIRSEDRQARFVSILTRQQTMAPTTHSTLRPIANDAMSVRSPGRWVTGSATTATGQRADADCIVPGNEDTAAPSEPMVSRPINQAADAPLKMPVPDPQANARSLTRTRVSKNRLRYGDQHVSECSSKTTACTRQPTRRGVGQAMTKLHRQTDKDTDTRTTGAESPLSTYSWTSQPTGTPAPMPRALLLQEALPKLVVFATLARNTSGQHECSICIGAGSLCGLRLHVTALADRRIRLRLVGAHNVESVEIENLVAALRDRDIEVVETIRE